MAVKFIYATNIYIYIYIKFNFDYSKGSDIIQSIAIRVLCSQAMFRYTIFYFPKIKQKLCYSIHKHIKHWINPCHHFSHVFNQIFIVIMTLNNKFVCLIQYSCVPNGL